ncbi:MAG TPA: hypothetical protein VMH61_08345 [Candidatus Acidoferrales bacterium]|nr:hypothetical protein [Candidatus Acidoferrales bacterium]
MRARIALLAPLLALLAALAGCSERDRANPLDPANPQTGGRPAGFTALADFDVVRLSWTAQPGLSIDGFRVLRFAPGDTAWQAITAVLPPSTGGVLDLAVANGRLYQYRLYYVIRGALGSQPAADHATPGPARPWVADDGSGELVRLTADGRHVLASFDDAGDVQSVGVDPGTGEVWTSAAYDGVVSVRTPDGLQPVIMQGLDSPFTLAITPFDHSAWICQSVSLAHRDPSGTAGVPAAIGPPTEPFDTPSGVAIDPRDFSIWVCENGGARLRHFARDGSPVSTGFEPLPSRAAVDSVTREVWVTSFERGVVLRLGQNAAVIDSSLAASGPIGLAVDPYRGRVWVADAVGNRVIALDPATDHVLFTVNGIAGAVDVSVDRATGDAWVVARSAQSIVHLDSNGKVLETLGGFSDPVGISVDPGLE